MPGCVRVMEKSIIPEAFMFCVTKKVPAGTTPAGLFSLRYRVNVERMPKRNNAWQIDKAAPR